MNALNWLFDTARFTPHGFCLLWRPDLVIIHVVSDAVIALSYFAIPVAIYIFAKRRLDLEPEHRRMAMLFAAFITACGLTHIVAIITLWAPYYGVQALLKAVTAVVSLITAAALPFLLPKLLALPSPKALQAANDGLAAEAAAHQATLEDLRAAQAALARQLSDRDEDLRIANHRFESALTNSPITVFEQDDQLRYTWTYNLPRVLEAVSIVGGTEADFMDPASASAVQAVKRAALTTGERQRAELQIEINGQSSWFDLQVQPMVLRDGRPGLVASSIDISLLKQHQGHMQLVMRELNHRSKNLLTIVQSIARQSAVGLDVPKAFLNRLGDRLLALASSHDVLVEQNWLGADLRSVIVGQLHPHLQADAPRVRLDGEPFELSPNIAHYVGMAMHELGANAAKYGALSNETGSVDISWSVRPDEEGVSRLHIVWREMGGPAPTETGRMGFGRIILETLTPRALRGEARLEFHPEGVTWTLTAPLGG